MNYVLSVLCITKFLYIKIHKPRSLCRAQQPVLRRLALGESKYRTVAAMKYAAGTILPFTSMLKSGKGYIITYLFIMAVFITD